MASRSFHLDPPPGFLGLRDDPPVTRYQRHLPHWRQEGATYFTTFRLADSLPAAALKDLRAIRLEWEGERETASDPNQDSEGLSQQIAQRIEYWLDQGHGSCIFRQVEEREVLKQALLFFDQSHGNAGHAPRYEIGSFVIMPNHAHCLVRPLDPEKHPLEDIERSWKQFVSRSINQRRQSSGALWFQECYDRIVRDAEHLYRCVQYIGRNPDKAGLHESEYLRWINPLWEDLGWGFRAK